MNGKNSPVPAVLKIIAVNDNLFAEESARSQFRDWKPKSKDTSPIRPTRFAKLTASATWANPDGSVDGLIPIPGTKAARVEIVPMIGNDNIPRVNLLVFMLNPTPASSRVVDPKSSVRQ